MKLQLKNHIVIQKQFNGDVAVLDFQKNAESYWVATGFAADVLLWLQQHDDKETILALAEASYQGNRADFERNLKDFTKALVEQGILLKPKKSTVAIRLTQKLLKSSTAKIKNPPVSDKKKVPHWTFHLTSLVSQEPLPAYADCMVDSDCPAGEICTWDANACFLYCWPAGT